MSHRCRTKEEILDQAVYAIACICRYYGEGYDEDYLPQLREHLKKLELSCHMPWNEDCVQLFDYQVDFCPMYLPAEFIDLKFSEIRSLSRGRQL